MTDQLGFFDRPLVEPTYAPEMGADQRFQAFHMANPQVFEELKRLALQATAKGHRRLGMKMLWEVLRWNRLMRTTDPDSEFKLNNNLHSRYARLLMERVPELVGIFELRELRS